MLNASAAFKTDSGKVFKEDVDIVPTIIDKSLSYIPWGSDNNMPYHIINLIESDETLATCQMFNAEVCYGSGLQYNTDSCGGDVKREVEDFLLDNALPSYFLGVCQDFKHFAFCVSVVILNAEGTRIVRLIRKEACYCRVLLAVVVGLAIVVGGEPEVFSHVFSEEGEVVKAHLSSHLLDALVTV